LQDLSAASSPAAVGWMVVTVDLHKSPEREVYGMQVRLSRLTVKTGWAELEWAVVVTGQIPGCSGGTGRF
jgi:hypothetical protein